MGLLLLFWACAAAAGTAVGFGMDPDLQIDIITELDLVNTTLGVTQVSGLHNASKAFLFQDMEREIHAAPHVSEKLVQLFRNKSEFTFLATLQQKASTSGVILSIRELEHSYFELESSGLRDEIRFHYGFSGKARTEVFPYRLADGQWHKVAVSLSASHLLLHVDCNRIYERVIDPPETNLTPESNLWLGQRNRKHGFFKGVIQDVKVIFIPNGYITQCPNLNRTKCIYGGKVLAEGQRVLTKSCRECRTIYSSCNDWGELPSVGLDRVLSWQIHDIGATTVGVEEHRHEKLTSSQRLLIHEGVQWRVHIYCQCNSVDKDDFKIFVSVREDIFNGVLVKVTETCPPLNCSEKDHVLPENQCCSVCRGDVGKFMINELELLACSFMTRWSWQKLFWYSGHNFCAEGHRCGENSECRNWNTKATCECKNGYLSVQGDSAYCEGYGMENPLYLYKNKFFITIVLRLKDVNLLD
ncbi:hypothetical protein DUI87_25635 [Hirundo rustica rustica]|uniref:Laminin G domain-containing protein n=1 Tax=Hirundo rustica rustica TaxID=333673 RepID=A0A3M0JB36_HIRRU|nr:hypothetical protein DUI87_25635 [Hirundo rustica rustica]